MSNSAFKKLRLSKGYRQTELARLLNVTVRYFAVGKSSTKDSMHRASVYGSIEAEKKQRKEIVEQL
jgi:transcriptional regulator with XRE-family HTH domain